MVSKSRCEASGGFSRTQKAKMSPAKQKPLTQPCQLIENLTTSSLSCFCLPAIQYPFTIFTLKDASGILFQQLTTPPNKYLSIYSTTILEKQLKDGCFSLLLIILFGESCSRI